MFNQSGVYQGVEWSVVHQGGRIFELTVGNKKEEYRCSYEPVFGLDGADQHGINLKLDAMQGISL